MSPGILNEAETIRQAPSLLGKQEFFDSGAGLNSYIDELWVDRRPLSKSLLVTSRTGHVMLGAVALAKRLKHWLISEENAQ